MIKHLIGDFRSAFKFHAGSFNRWLFLTTARLLRGLPGVATANYAKWIPAMEVALGEAGECNGYSLGLGRRNIHSFECIAKVAYCS